MGYCAPSGLHARRRKSHSLIQGRRLRALRSRRLRRVAAAKDGARVCWDESFPDGFNLKA